MFVVCVCASFAFACLVMSLICACCRSVCFICRCVSGDRFSLLGDVFYVRVLLFGLCLFGVAFRCSFLFV